MSYLVESSGRYIVFVPACDAGGIRTYALRLLQGLVKIGCKVLVVLWRDVSAPYSIKVGAQFEDFEQVWVEFNSLEHERSIVACFSKEICFRSNDVVISQVLPFVTAVVCAERRRVSFSYIEVLHGDTSEYYDRLRAVRGVTDAVVVPSLRMQRHAQTLCGTDAIVSVIPPGIPSLLTDNPVDQSLRRSDGFCFVGRLSKEKRIDRIIDAFGVISTDLGRGRLSIAGGGELSDALKLRARRFPESNIELIGKVPPEQVLSVYRANRWLVLASKYEGLPLVLLEAMSHGVVPIVPRISGCEDVVRHGLNGYLFDPLDPGALQKSLEVAMATSDHCWQSLSAASVETASKYSVMDMARSYIALANRLQMATPTVRLNCRKRFLDQLGLPPGLLRLIRIAWRRLRMP